MRSANRSSQRHPPAPARELLVAARGPTPPETVLPRHPRHRCRSRGRPIPARHQWRRASQGRSRAPSRTTSSQQQQAQPASSAAYCGGRQLAIETNPDAAPLAQPSDPGEPGHPCTGNRQELAGGDVRAPRIHFASAQIEASYARETHTESLGRGLFLSCWPAGPRRPQSGPASSGRRHGAPGRYRACGGAAPHGPGLAHLLAEPGCVRHGDRDQVATAPGRYRGRDPVAGPGQAPGEPQGTDLTTYIYTNEVILLVPLKLAPASTPDRST